MTSKNLHGFKKKGAPSRPLAAAYLKTIVRPGLKTAENVV